MPPRSIIPNICTVYEVGDANDFAFIAMEYVEGRSLRDRIDPQAAAGYEAVRYGLHTADALAYAHEHGVVHRDFKAANAIVGDDGPAEGGRFRAGPAGRCAALAEC